jgi:hypothetical protein
MASAKQLSKSTNQQINKSTTHFFCTFDTFYEGDILLHHTVFMPDKLPFMRAECDG